jgi:hypothetical protein
MTNPEGVVEGKGEVNGVKRRGEREGREGEGGRRGGR